MARPTDMEMSARKEEICTHRSLERGGRAGHGTQDQWGRTRAGQEAEAERREQGLEPLLGFSREVGEAGQVGCVNLGLAGLSS